MKKIALVFLSIVVSQASLLYAETKSYSGNGISFEYPADYSLQESSVTNGKKIYMKIKGNNISLVIYKSKLEDNFPGDVTSAIEKRYKEIGYEIIKVKSKKDKMVFKIEGGSGKANVDVVKTKIKCKVNSRDLEQYL